MSIKLLNGASLSKLSFKLKNNLKYRVAIPIELGLLHFVDDETYTRHMYRYIFGKEIDLRNPRTFNEKIHYLKLNDRSEEYTRLADKHAAREFIAAKGWGHLLSELYGVYESVDEIDLARLPAAFVIKATHGSGWNIFCPDKSQLDWEAERKKIRRWLRTNFYGAYREWVYKDIRPGLLIEEYLENPGDSSLNDYKFFCFHSEPKFVQVDVDRFQAHKRNLYDLDWNILPCRYAYPNSEREIPKPENLEEMVAVSRSLSEDLPFARVDLYSCQGKTKFGEITFYPEGGFKKFEPEAYDEVFGEYLDLEKAMHK